MATLTTTKSALTEAVAAKMQIPKARAEQIVNLIFDSMESALKAGDRIELRGFGSFEVRTYKAYAGRNPRNGDAVAVEPKRLPFFRPGKELKIKINEAATKTSRRVTSTGR